MDSKGCRHLHLFCAKCGKIIEIEEDFLVGDFPTKILGKYNFEVQDINPYGSCRECSKI
jgi:Fe2+ or Zn2+ uptake regulation protein